MRHLVVTGGRGYIGQALVRAGLALGWHVTSLERRPSSSQEGRLRRLPWQLGEALPAALLQGTPPAEMLIHVAHIWDTAGESDDPNRLGTDELFRSARAAGIGRFVFVSSVSARLDALNAYGRLKWRIEQSVSAQGGVSARVGLVYGGPRRAQYGVLARLTGMGVLPMIDPQKAVQPIHLSELCQGLLAMAGAATLSHPVYVLAAPTAVTFAGFLRSLARELHQRSLLIVPVPAAVALLICDVSQRIPFLPKVNRERVLGLKGMQFVDGGDGLSELGLAIEDIATNLRREPALRLRRLVREGAALLAYNLGVRPPAQLLRRYVRAVRASPDKAPIELSALSQGWPFLLRGVEPLHRQSTNFARRLELATRLAETSTIGTDLFFAYRGTRFRRLAGATVQVFLDLLALPCRLVRRARG
jgi:nucleoside-diphosphate-sugar epimerase